MVAVLLSRNHPGLPDELRIGDAEVEEQILARTLERKDQETEILRSINRTGNIDICEELNLALSLEGEESAVPA